MNKVSNPIKSILNMSYYHNSQNNNFGYYNKSIDIIEFTEKQVTNDRSSYLNFRIPQNLYQYNFNYKINHKLINEVKIDSLLIPTNEIFEFDKNDIIIINYHSSSYPYEANNSFIPFWLVNKLCVKSHKNSITTFKFNKDMFIYHKKI